MLKKVMLLTTCLIGEMRGRDRTVIETIKGPKITQCTNHHGTIRDQLVLYFSSQPNCLYIPTRAVVENNNQPVTNADGFKELVYFFPTQAMTPKEIARYARYVKDAACTDTYSVSLEYDKHKKGIVLAIAFKDSEVGFQCESYTAITGEPALRMAFIKRASLNAIEHNKNHLFNTAFYKKKMG